MRFPLDRGIKKPHPSETFRSRTRTRLSPCYHLASRAPRGGASQRVLPYPDPVTGIPRRSLTAFFCGSVRGSKAIFRARLPHPARTVRDSLCRISRRTFLFIACNGIIIAPCFLPVKRAKRRRDAPAAVLLACLLFILSPPAPLLPRLPPPGPPPRRRTAPPAGFPALPAGAGWCRHTPPRRA